MTASEKLMRKKKVYKAELDKATSMSGELWERATGRLDEIRTRYGLNPLQKITYIPHRIRREETEKVALEAGKGIQEAIAGHRG